MSQNSKFRAVPFTLNNYTPQEAEDIKLLKDKVVYIVVGEEVGEKGTPHLQGYLYFQSPRSLSSLKKTIPRAHFSVPCKGTHQENSDYCAARGKHENKAGWKSLLIEAGTMPKQGERTDIEVTRDELKDGANIRRILDITTSYQSVKMAETWLKYNEKGRDWRPEVRWFHGSTGSGKTKAAIEWLGSDYYTPVNFKWWEGYDAHENVLLDEIRGDFCKFHEMLKLLDRYKYRVECKGGSRQLLAKKIAITSPYPPDQVWNKNPEDVQQLIRRIDDVILKGEAIAVYTILDSDDEDLLESK